MQADTFSGEQLAIDSLLQQHVPKPVRIPLDAKHLVVDCLPGRCQQSDIGELGGGGQKVMLGWPPYCRG